jgi:hypothetical protein
VVSFSIVACAAITSPAVVAAPTRIAEMAMSVVMIIYASTVHWIMGEIVNTVISATAIVAVISKYPYLSGGLGKSAFLAVLVFFLLDVKVETTRACGEAMKTKKRCSSFGKEHRLMILEASWHRCILDAANFYSPTPRDRFALHSRSVE